MKKSNLIYCLLAAILFVGCSIDRVEKNNPVEIIQRETNEIINIVENCSYTYQGILKFEEFDGGEVVEEINTENFRIKVSSDENSLPMIFDSSNYTGEDSDLNVNSGNILIISEDGNSLDPDDSETGGKLSMLFEKNVNPKYIKVIDIEEEGSFIVLSSKFESTTIPITPTLDGGFREVDLGFTDNIGLIEVFLKGSGGIDDLIYEINLTKTDCNQ